MSSAGLWLPFVRYLDLGMGSASFVIANRALSERVASNGKQSAERQWLQDHRHVLLLYGLDYGNFRVPIRDNGNLGMSIRSALRAIANTALKERDASNRK